MTAARPPPDGRHRARSRARALATSPIATPAIRSILFRIFHYPPLPAGVEAEALWSVGEHTDYGLLTILMQDEIGGLAVKSKGGWIEAPPIEGAFVCNLGDMLDRMTGGLYRSTPHRVRNRSDRGRLSFPFFFDPGWNASDPADPDRRAATRRPRRALGPRQRPRVERHLRRLSVAQGRQGSIC